MSEAKKVAFITGATSGFGEAAAHFFIEHKCLGDFLVDPGLNLARCCGPAEG